MRAGVLIAAVAAAFVLLPVAGAAACDPLDPSACLYPWPNDHFTRADPTSPTGKRLALQDNWMPKNRFGIPVSAAPYNWNDGFSPGNMIVTKVPGLDTPEAFRRTGAVPITDIERTYDAAQPIVVINARTLERHLIWSELDANPADPRDVTLIIRPAVNFQEGERYIVALRNLKDARGHTLKPQPAFKALRDRRPDPEIEARRPHYEQLFGTLGQAGIKRQDLYLAWDFTVASREGLSGRALKMRNDAFAELGDTNLADGVPAGTEPVFTANPDIPDDAPEEAVALDGRRDLGDSIRISGNVRVPCFLDAPGCPPGSEFNIGPDGLPQRPGKHDARGRRLRDPEDPAARPAAPVAVRPWAARQRDRGDRRQRPRDGERARLRVLCHRLDRHVDPRRAERARAATGPVALPNARRPRPAGLRELHVPGPLDAEARLGRRGRGSVKPVLRRQLAGRHHGRRAHRAGARLHARGPRRAGNELLDPAAPLGRLRMYAHGDIEGTGDTELGLYDAYPNELERPLLLSLIQLLWDRGEANGYALHMTGDPLPGTPAHEVLMHEAFADHQVANITTEVEARTIGASIRWPALAPGRHTDVNSYFGIPQVSTYPFDGSALVVWDTGIPAPPTTNTPPRAGQDPHGAPRNSPKGRRQKSEFLRPDGALIDVCDGLPCVP